NEREQDLNRHLRMLTESQQLGGIGSYDYDLATDTVAWTSNTYKIFGIPDGTPLDFNKALSVYSPSDAATLVTRSEHAFKTGQGFEMDAIIYRQSDQQERYLYIRCEVQRDNKLLISGLRGIVQDVTE